MRPASGRWPPRDPDGHPVLVSSIQGPTSYDVSDRPKREEALR